MRPSLPVLFAVLAVCCGGGAYAGSGDTQKVQCAQYAREHSAVHLLGHAATWWDQAAGAYTRGARPSGGAVLLLHTGSEHGHAAVVTRLVSSREIRIDHANWLNDGAIYRNNPVADVSQANDWSQVRVWNIQTGTWGGKTYKVRGFITAPEGVTGPLDDRNPPANSGFALTAEDRQIPSRLLREE